MTAIRLNLGCGNQTPAGWVNVDYALGARLFKIPLFAFLNRRLNLISLSWNENIFLHDLRKPFPWKDETVDAIYSSHTLEHFTKSDGLAFLRECHRALKAGGLIRIVVPDLKVIVNEYLKGEIRADEFLEKLEVAYERKGDSGYKKKLAPFIRFPHRCMYDNTALVTILREIGFDVRERRPFESDIPAIHQVELQGRTENSVIVEGKKNSGRVK